MARALQLDAAERLHLFNLARATKPRGTTRPRRTQPVVRGSVQRVLESMADAPAFADPARPVNLARFCFLDPAARDFYPDWDEVAHSTDCAGHNVTLHQHGNKHFDHPVVGLIDVSFDSMNLPADPGLTLTAYSTEPGSPSHDALALLASWNATTAAASEPTGPAAHQTTDKHLR